ncbi:hypothetical protein ES288_D10G137400v1 [Gossypium darwinii]|uniref:Uncharacterized protein n=1 Tax=Gossypium darwinii TaxID=34276 RepID=A0A5D2AZH0_GOSDA|nr:hypothetical protein ES288_D10G137400v1 [Gossypium darwinii]
MAFQKARRHSGDSLPPKTPNLRPNSDGCGVNKNLVFRHHAHEEWLEGELVRDSGG